jgi:hypothetical protein
MRLMAMLSAFCAEAVKQMAGRRSIRNPRSVFFMLQSYQSLTMNWREVALLPDNELTTGIGKRCLRS